MRSYFWRSPQNVCPLAYCTHIWLSVFLTGICLKIQRNYQKIPVMSVLIPIQQTQKCTKMLWKELHFFIALFFSFSITIKFYITTQNQSSYEPTGWCWDVMRIDVPDVYRENQDYKYFSLKIMKNRQWNFSTAAVVYRDCILCGSRYLMKNTTYFYFL